MTGSAALDVMFARAVTDGCEGLVRKSTGLDSAYRGARGWQWIKLKRDYRTELSDTADMVVVGAFAGRGRRTGVYGAVLLAAYDADVGVLRAVTKCGAGFSDADLATLPARLAPLLSSHKPARVDARQEPDVWAWPCAVGDRQPRFADQVTTSGRSRVQYGRGNHPVRVGARTRRGPTTDAA